VRLADLFYLIIGGFLPAISFLFPQLGWGIFCPKGPKEKHAAMQRAFL